MKINEPELVKNIIHAFIEFADKMENIYQLNVKNGKYFSLASNISRIQSGAGWYVIVDDKKYPLYIGTASNLNKRLNTNSGSLDNFNNQNRKTDSIRNFIKKYNSLGLISKLFVIIIYENDLREWMKTICTNNITNPLTPLDRNNIEKIISIYRSNIFNYKAILYK
ncbi:MAG: hypothetical protein P4L35_01490 [Ignavibacteriaceae bacterium]|nr:hypothetical protein [Ignavibacteriaceae bacterium]